MTSEISTSDVEQNSGLHTSSILPLALLISFGVAIVTAIDAYLCGCALLEILWLYSRNGVAAFLMSVALFSAFWR